MSVCQFPVPKESQREEPKNHLIFPELNSCAFRDMQSAEKEEVKERSHVSDERNRRSVMTNKLSNRNWSRLIRRAKERFNKDIQPIGSASARFYCRRRQI
jgi:hypothetical protein